MSDNRIDASQPKRYEEDPAKIAEDKAKADFEASKMTTSKSSCSEDPERFPCAPPAKDKTPTGVPFEDLAKTMSQPKPTPAPAPNAQRDAWQKEADQIADRLSKNPVPYKGKAEDQARLRELQGKIAGASDEKTIAIPNTNDASRKAGTPDGLLHGTAGQDGASVHTGGTVYQKTANGPNGEQTKVQVLDASVQVGLNTEANWSAVRVTDTTASGTTTYEGPAMHSAIGVGRNDDGSTGYHAGVSAQIGSVTKTQNLDNGGTVTYGASEGAGVGFSVGGKTTANGDPAACVQVSALFFTFGACLPVNRF